MALSLSDVRDQVGRLLRDRANVHTAAADLSYAIREAHREVWHEVYLANPDFWQPVTQLYTWPTDQLDVDVDTIIPGPDYRLRLICTTPRVGTIMRTNLPYPLRRRASEDMYANAARGVDINPWEQEYGGWVGSVGGGMHHTWDLRGTTLRLDPIPTQPVQLVFYYCTPPDSYISDSLVLMDRRLIQHERVLVYGAALHATQKDRYSDDTWAQAHATYMRRIIETVHKWTNDGTAYVSLAGW